jgi:hypothetical protein
MPKVPKAAFGIAAVEGVLSALQAESNATIESAIR